MVTEIYAFYVPEELGEFPKGINRKHMELDGGISDYVTQAYPPLVLYLKRLHLPFMAGGLTKITKAGNVDARK